MKDLLKRTNPKIVRNAKKKASHMLKKIKPTFGEVVESQNFQFWDTGTNKPVWARKTGNMTAVSEGNIEHVFYPSDQIMAVGKQVHGIPMTEVRGNPNVVLLCSDQYWTPTTLDNAVREAALLGLCTYRTPVHILRKNNDG